jgi:hypothetical protein
MLVGYFFALISHNDKKNYLLFLFYTFILLICGSKLVAFCSFLIILINKSYFGDNYKKTILFYFLSYFIYYLVFPIVFKTNFTFDALVFSFGIRLIDQLDSFGNIFNFLFSDEVVDAYTKIDSNDKGFTGVIFLILFFILSCFLYFSYKHKFFLFFKSRFISPKFKFLYKSILIWIFFVFFTTPLFGNHLISFIIGLLFSPFLTFKNSDVNKIF